MISLQRSMHSSQMYTPGPAMSFLTCFWLFPQNEHFSRSPPSPMRATQFLLYMGPPAPGRSSRLASTLCVDTVLRNTVLRNSMRLDMARGGGHPPPCRQPLAIRRYRLVESDGPIKPPQRPGREEVRH